MKTSELVNKLNELEIQQTNWWEEDLQENIWIKHFKGAETLKSGLNVDKHRWYECTTTVLAPDNTSDDGIIGVVAVTDLFSESMDYESCCHTLYFVEMEEVKEISYKEKS